jgi:hypothetical protein
MHQQVIGAFLHHQHQHHQHHAPWRRPGTGLVLKVVAPLPRLLGWTARWPLQVRCRQLLQADVAAQPAQILDVAIFQGRIEKTEKIVR